MRANEITPKAIDWLWHPYIPYGKISLVAGQMGQAKSLFTVWLADYATARRGVNVIMLSAEDEGDTDLRPRLEAVGADLGRVEISSRDVTLSAGQLEKLCDEVGKVRLITVDPISAYLDSRVNSWKGQDVRLALEPIRRLAAERSIAVVLVQHLNRRTDGDPLARIADSQGIPQLARSVMVWGPNPEDPEGDQGSMKVLTRAKCNLAPPPKASSTFTVNVKKVTGGITAVFLVRGHDVQVNAEDVITDQETRTALDEAVDWLSGRLVDGEPHEAKMVQREAHEVGIADRTLRRARRKLGVVSERIEDDSHKVRGWTYRLPLPDNPAYTSGHLGHVGHLGHADKSQAAQVSQMSIHTEESPNIAALERLTKLSGL